jgi:hypothetical protein
MKPEKQRIAIAEACGWTDVKGTKGVHPKARFKGCGYADDWIALPDYLNNLNAMHEAEKVLSRGEHYNQTGGFGLYVQNLDFVRCGRKHLIEATAAERARAFLLTLGKWEEEA